MRHNPLPNGESLPLNESAGSTAGPEGTIRFAYGQNPLTRPRPSAALSDLDAWRRILVDLGLVGQRDDRYDGYGYGNISARDPDDAHHHCI